MTRPSCVPSSALLPGRGLPLSGDPGDPHLGVTLAGAPPSPVAGLVLEVNDVDLGGGYRAHDLRGDLVAPKLIRIADDLAVIDDEHGRKRHAGPDLTSEGVDGQDVVHRRHLLPATAAHDRVHRRTLSLLVRAHRVAPRLRTKDTKGGSPALHRHTGNPALDSSRALGLQVIRPRRPPMPPAPPARVARRPCRAGPARAWPPCAPPGPAGRGGAAAWPGGRGSRVAARGRRRPRSGWAGLASACSPAPGPFPAASPFPAGSPFSAGSATAGWPAAAMLAALASARA